MASGRRTEKLCSWNLLKKLISLQNSFSLRLHPSFDFIRSSFFSIPHSFRFHWLMATMTEIIHSMWMTFPFINDTLWRDKFLFDYTQNRNELVRWYWKVKRKCTILNEDVMLSRENKTNEDAMIRTSLQVRFMKMSFYHLNLINRKLNEWKEALLKAINLQINGSLIWHLT